MLLEYFIMTDSFRVSLSSFISATVRIIRLWFRNRLIIVEVSAAYWYCCRANFSTLHDGVKMSSKEVILWIVIYFDLATFGAQCRRFLNSRLNLGFKKIREYIRTCSLSSSSNADVKNAWTYTSISLYVFMVSRDNFIFHISVSFLNL